MLVKDIIPSMWKCNRKYFSLTLTFTSKSSNSKGFLVTSARVTSMAGEQRRAVPRIALRRGWAALGVCSPCIPPMTAQCKTPLGCFKAHRQPVLPCLARDQRTGKVALCHCSPWLCSASRRPNSAQLRIHPSTLIMAWVELLSY